MINELLYGLEMILGVCVTSSNSSKLQMAGVRRIYRPPSLVAIAPTVSRKNYVSSDEPMPLAGVASVHQVTLSNWSSRWLLTQLQHSRDHRLNRCLGRRFNRSHTAADLAVALFSSADVIAPTLYSDAPSVEPVLKDLLLGTWHRLWNTVCPMHRCLTWFRRFNRCLTWSSLDLQRRSNLHPTPGRQIIRQTSDAPML